MDDLIRLLKILNFYGVEEDDFYCACGENAYILVCDINIHHQQEIIDLGFTIQSDCIILNF